MFASVRVRAKTCALLTLRRGKLFLLAALALALEAGPDLLNAVAGVDWAPLLPAGWGVKVAGWLVVFRLVLPILAMHWRIPPSEPDEGPR